MSSKPKASIASSLCRNVFVRGYTCLGGSFRPVLASGRISNVCFPVGGTGSPPMYISRIQVEFVRNGGSVSRLPSQPATWSHYTRGSVLHHLTDSSVAAT